MFENPTLIAVMDRIVPADGFPSASEAGVGEYLRRIVAHERAADLPVVEAFLTELDAAAARESGATFAALPPERQDAMLREREATRGFHVLLELVMEGYYADPMNGGNKNAASWRMIGFVP